MRRTVVLVVSIVAVALATSPIPASATSVGRTDGNDVAFPLDIASVTVTHATGAHVFELRAHNGFTNTQIAPANGWFRIGFDLDGDSGWERNLFIQYVDGRIRGFMVNESLDRLLRRVETTRLSASSLRSKVPLDALEKATSYRFMAWSVYRSSPCSKSDPCLDFLPNSGWVVHDHRPPTARIWALPDPSTEDYVTPTIRVNFSVQDGAGSGIKWWRLEARPLGTKTWALVRKGTAAGRSSTSFTGTQGLTYEFRLVAVDRAGHERVSNQPRVTFPFDDANDRISFGPADDSWDLVKGVWKAYQETWHVSQVEGARMRISVKAGKGVPVCFLGGPVDAAIAADVTIDGKTTAEALREYRTTERRQRVGCVSTTTAGPWHTVTVEVPSGVGFVIDGVYVG